jgi:hypothetical protein
MATNQYGQTEWDADPETAAELRRLSNQEKMAAAMAAKGQQPLTGGMVGNTYVGASPLQGIANMLHQYNASKATQGAEEGYRALGESNRIRRDNEIGKIVEVMQGRQEQPMGPPTPTGDMGVREAVPAGTKEQVLQAMMTSRMPAYRDAGLKSMLADKMKSADWEVVEQYDPNGNKQKVLIDKNNPTQQKPFGSPSVATSMFKEVFVKGPKDEPYVQKKVSTDNGRTWVNEGDASPRFAKQVASTVVVGGNDAKYAPVSVVKRGPDGKDAPNLGTELISRKQAIDEKRTLGSSDATIQGGIAGAKSEAREVGEGAAKARLTLPGAQKIKDTVFAHIDTMLAHPGFESYIGATLRPFASKVDGTPEADMKAKLDQLEGGAFLEAFEKLKGGGAITEIEGTKATVAMNRMKKSTSEAEFKMAAQDYKNALTAGFEKLEAQSKMGRLPAGASGSFATPGTPAPPPGFTVN